MTSDRGGLDETRAYYDEFSKSYERHRRPNRADGYHALVDDLEVELCARYGTGKDVLECGCGTGLILERIARHARRAVGIDLSPGMLELARARGLHVEEGSLTKLPFEDASFDVTCSFKVLAHVPDIGLALSEMARSPPIKLAFGKRSSRSCTRASGSLPKNMAAMPLSLAATRIDPSEHSPTAKRMSALAPPERKLLGVMPRISSELV